MSGTLTRLVGRLDAWWSTLSKDTLAKYAKALGLPELSNWRLLPYFLLLLLLFLAFPLFLLIARIIIRRARKKDASA